MASTSEPCFPVISDQGDSSSHGSRHGCGCNGLAQLKSGTRTLPPLGALLLQGRAFLRFHVCFGSPFICLVIGFSFLLCIEIIRKVRTFKRLSLG